LNTLKELKDPNFGKEGHKAFAEEVTEDSLLEL